jgi:hypothetical protein
MWRSAVLAMPYQRKLRRMDHCRKARGRRGGRRRRMRSPWDAHSVGSSVAVGCRIGGRFVVQPGGGTASGRRPAPTPRQSPWTRRLTLGCEHRSPGRETEERRQLRDRDACGSNSGLLQSGYPGSRTLTVSERRRRRVNRPVWRLRFPAIKCRRGQGCGRRRRGRSGAPVPTPLEAAARSGRRNRGNGLRP